MGSIQILIADDHELLRRSLRSLIESQPNWHVCAEAADGIEAVEKTKKLRPDVVLMDMTMPRMDGAEATRKIRREIPESQVVIVSQNDPGLMRKLADQVGARAYVSKANLVRDLLPAISKIVKESHSHEAELDETPKHGGVDWLFGGGSLAALIREHDWSQTPLGPLVEWPQSLRTAVNLMLNSQHPMWIGWGPAKTFLYNEAYISVLSLAKHPLALGKPASDVWAEIWDVCGPLADNVFERGEPSFVDEVRLFMNRGDYLEETYYSFSYSPIYDESGKVSGLFCPSAEITAKVLNARRLRTLSELSAKSLIEKSRDTACRSCIEIISQNPDDIPFALLYLFDENRNTARLEGSCHITEGLDRVSPVSVALGREAKSLLWPIRKLAEGGLSRTVPLESSEPLPYGPAQQRLREAIILPVTSRGMDRPIGVLIAGVNPTRKLDSEYRTFFTLVADQVASAIQNATALQQEKERIDALLEIDRAKTAFFSNVSHEFRTPLTLMLGPLEDSLAAADQLPAEHRERLEVAHRNSARLLRLVNNLLDFSRIEAGRIEASYEPTDLATFTTELASVFRSAVERAGLRLVIDCSPIAEPVYIDREMWEKIVFNLLSNAFKFTFDGEIRLSLHVRDGSVELSVSDTGTGIPEEEIPHLFERFHRVKGARGRTFEGSGIGLSLVQELVKLHGGTVRVESQIDRGTTFTVSIPLGKKHLPEDRLGAPRKLESTGVRGEAYVQEALRWLPAGGSEEFVPIAQLEGVADSRPQANAKSEPALRILIADDNADMREYLQRLLRQDYEVEAVTDGEAALKSARERRPDLILSDIMMPRMDGFGLLRAVRGDEALKTVPVILLSARAGEEARIEGIQSGADDYLIKPFSARELLARVGSNIALAKIRRDAEELRSRMRRDSDLLASIVASSDDAIISKNLDGIITSWNKSAERMYGYTAEEAIGQSIMLVVPHDRRDEEATILARLRRGERIDHFQTIRARKDGTTLDVSLTISPIRDGTGRVIGASKVARDITLEKRVQQALQDSEERYRNLAESLEAEVLARTRELEERNIDILRQSEQLRSLSQNLLHAQDEERRRVARELHDSAGQTLTVLGLNIAQLAEDAKQIAPEHARQAEEIQQLVRHLQQEIRTTSYLLHPPLLDEAGLSSALNWYVQGMVERSGLQIELNISEDFGRLPTDVELLIFRLVQECLTNILRHSGSKSAWIELTRNPEQIILEVRDQGKGISAQRLAEIQSGGSGVGIRGMRERLRQLEGTLTIQSDGGGTQVSVTIPFPQTLVAAGQSKIQSVKD
jgi:PAS domain S-box-containing protein